MLLAQLRETDRLLRAANIEPALAGRSATTSASPLTELALQTLHDAKRGDFMRLDAAALHDLEVARAMTPQQRLAALDALMRRAQALGPPQPNREPIQYTDIRM